MRTYILSILFCFIGVLAIAQNLEVTVVNDITKEGVEEVQITYNLENYLTNSKGVVSIPIDLSKSIVFSVSKDGYTSTILSIDDANGMNSYRISLKQTSSANDNVIILDEEELQEEDDDFSVSSILRASKDPFLSAAAYNFGVGRFKVRGYKSDYSSTYLNGLPMMTLHNSRSPYNFWGGLNDALRNTTTNFGMDHAEFGFGNLNGGSNTNISAGKQRKQTKASYSITNRSYRNRLMVTHSSGEQANGWSYSLSGSRRWAQEGYSEGTPYDAWSYYASVEKKISDNNKVSLTIFGSPQKRGTNSGSLEEMYKIAGDNYYNSNWGYLNGKKINARAWNTHQPMINLKQELNINSKLTLNHAIGLITGRTGRTRLDWYNAPDPRPDYYRYLPSYVENEEGSAKVFDILANDVNKRQLNWGRMFDVNRNNPTTLNNVNGNGETISGLRSLYSLQENREDLTRYMYTATARYQLTESSTLHGGFTAQHETTHFFQEMNNLLGGEFWYDVNQFVEREFPGNNEANQADLNNPNRVIKQGDTYGYNYNSSIKDATIWTSYNAILPKVDFHFGAQINYNHLQREGLYKNGAFPDNSFGDSEGVSFLSPSVKGGINYKINGRNYVYANVSYTEKAPDFRNTFISPRFRNSILDNLTTEKAMSGEVAYVLRAPKMKLKALGYYTQIRDIARVRSFFIDGSSSAFVNFISQNEGHNHIGTEIAAEYKITSTFSIKYAAGIGQNYIAKRPTVKIIQDNTGNLIREKETIYVKNFRLPGAQSAHTLGLSYNSPKYWFVTLSANYFDHLYLDYNPLRRTSDAVEGLDRTSDFYFEILKQTKLDPGFTLDLFGGKSWKVNDQYFNLLIGVNNMLNNRDIISGGFEQVRLRTVNNSNTIESLDRFPDRHFYAWGMNYFVNLSYRL